MWSFDAEETIDHAFFKRRIAAAVAARAALPELADQQGLRLIHGESDGLPGVIADRYGETVVLQLNSAGAEKWREALVAALLQATGCARVFERSDSDVRGLEGLEARAGALFGGEPDQIVIGEHGIRLEVDIRGGHKTGFYLDQRENRRLVRALAAGRSVLNCFCYTGGFSLQALAGGAASVLSIDSSGPALEGARRNLALNPQLDAEARRVARRRRLRGAARAEEGRRALRPDRPRSAQVRALGGPCRSRRARLQGHQPARLPPAQSGRIADDLLLLGRHRPGALPEDRRRRGQRCRRGCAHPAASLGGARPSGGAGLPGRRVPEGPALPGGMIAAP
jgi:hypothetical protein